MFEDTVAMMIAKNFQIKTLKNNNSNKNNNASAVGLLCF